MKYGYCGMTANVMWTLFELLSRVWPCLSRYPLIPTILLGCFLLFILLLFLIIACIYGHILNMLHLKYNMPWLVMGDFNELSDTTDKIGGRPLIASRVHAFQECLNPVTTLRNFFMVFLNKHKLHNLIKRKFYILTTTTIKKYTNT